MLHNFRTNQSKRDRLVFVAVLEHHAQVVKMDFQQATINMSYSGTCI